MMEPTPQAARPATGDTLAAFDKAFSTVDLMAYGAATWDWHRLHYDQDYARSRNLPNPIIDGQVYGAVFAKQAIDWSGPRGFIVRMNIRMRSMAFAGDTLRCEGEVSAVRDDGDMTVATLAQRLVNADRVTAECTTELRLPR